MQEDQDTLYTSLRITKKLRDALKDLGRKGESYENIIWGLMPSSKDLPEAHPRRAFGVKADIPTQQEPTKSKASQSIAPPTGKKRGGTKVALK